MPKLVIGDIADTTYRSLVDRAERHGVSAEVEARTILDQAIRPLPAPDKVGSVLSAFGKRYGGLDLEIPGRTAPARAVDFK